MANVDIRITAQNRSQQAIRQLNTDLEKLSKSEKSINVESERLQKNAVRLQTSFGNLSRVIGTIGVTAAVAGFTRSIIQAGTRLETMRNGLTAVVGSAAEAERTLNRLQQIAQLPGISLEQAIDASINLRSVGLEADLVERSLKAVGNALAIVGRPEELSGVVLGMTQMVSSGKVLQEEINQIASRIPQFRQAMIDAFGTARSEDIQQMGISAEDFLSRTIAQLERLPAATGGAQNAVSNLQNAMFEFTSAAGTAILPAFTALVERMTVALNAATEAGMRLGILRPAAQPTDAVQSEIDAINMRIEEIREGGMSAIPPLGRHVLNLRGVGPGAEIERLISRRRELEAQLPPPPTQAPPFVPRAGRRMGLDEGFIQFGRERIAELAIARMQGTGGRIGTHPVLAQQAFDLEQARQRREADLAAQIAAGDTSRAGLATQRELAAARIEAQFADFRRQAVPRRALQRLGGEQFGADLGAAIGRAGFGGFDAFQRRREFAERLRDDLVRLEEEREQRVKDIRENEVLSIRQKTEQIERIENESAKRREGIERELAETQKGIFSDIAGSFKDEMERMARNKIIAQLIDSFSNVVGQKAAGQSAQVDIGATVGGGIGTFLGSLIGVPGLGAFIGKNLGSLLNFKASFDNPANDMMAFQMGRRRGMNLMSSSGSFSLGERSAQDLARHFDRGFAEGSRGAGASGGNIEVKVELQPIWGDDMVKFVERRKSVMVRQGRA